MKDVEKYEINVIVGNGQKIKCKLKGSVKKNLGRTNSEALPNSCTYHKQLKKLSVSRLVSKGAMMGDTQDKMTINKNGVSMILYASKGQNKIIMFYLKAKI